MLVHNEIQSGIGALSILKLPQIPNDVNVGTLADKSGTIPFRLLSQNSTTLSFVNVESQPGIGAAVATDWLPERFGDVF